MARASRQAALSVSRSPRSKINIWAPEGASPAAIVAPPMPEPTMRISGGAISMAQATRASLTGSKNTAFSMLKAKGTRSPGNMRASERIRAITSRPPSRVTT